MEIASFSEGVSSSFLYELDFNSLSKDIAEYTGGFIAFAPHGAGRSATEKVLTPNVSGYNHPILEAYIMLYKINDDKIPYDVVTSFRFDKKGPNHPTSTYSMYPGGGLNLNTNTSSFVNVVGKKITIPNPYRYPVVNGTGIDDFHLTFSYPHGDSTSDNMIVEVGDNYWVIICWDK